MNLDYFSAFLIGFLGSGHCIAMCGGVVGMLSSASKTKQSQSANVLNQQNNDSPHIADENVIIPTTTISNDSSISSPCSANSNFSFAWYYNLGRILTYALIGGIIGFTGSMLAKNIGAPLAALRIISAIFLIFLGLYIGQWLMWLNRVEMLGKHLWTRLSPLTKYVLPVNTKTKAFGLGAIWGWLPCGLVYSTLTWSMASGSFIDGAVIMLFFGLGTLPAVLTMSLSFTHFINAFRSAKVKNAMALILIFYGFYSLVIAYKYIF